MTNAYDRFRSIGSLPEIVPQETKPPKEEKATFEITLPIVSPEPLQEATDEEISDFIRKAADDKQNDSTSAATELANRFVMPLTHVPEPEVYQYPPLSLLQKQPPADEKKVEEELAYTADKLVEILSGFGVKTSIHAINRGPSVTRYELQPLTRDSISQITSLADNIALGLACSSVRIETPIPGRQTIGIEIPNRKRTLVNIRSILESAAYTDCTSPLRFTLGMDTTGTAQVVDLAKMPHLLIAGNSNSGKSVCIDSIITSLLYNAGPEDVRLIMIDTKVVELSDYNGIPHFLVPVVIEPRRGVGALGAAMAEVERRFTLFAENNVWNIKAFNQLAETSSELEKMPYIVILVDDLADLMLTFGKETEDYICRLAHNGPKVGVHLIVATQRTSVDVITGLIKPNIPSRIAFVVSSPVDSRAILDSVGAEKLLGMGDMLFLPVGASKPVRIQGTYVRDEELIAVLDFIKQHSHPDYNEEMVIEMEKCAVVEKVTEPDGDGEECYDPMLEQAVETVIAAGMASTSLLQRRCKLGYGCAARLIDQLEQTGVIGPYRGAKPRELLITRQQWLEMRRSILPEET